MTLPNLWIVDDDPMACFYMERLTKIKSLADSVTIFNCAVSSLDFLSENVLYPELLPDVILLDIYMPVVDGWFFLKNFQQLKNKLRKEITIFLMSSSANPRDLNKASQIAEVREYIVKPLTLKKLGEISFLFFKKII